MADPKRVCHNLTHPLLLVGPLGYSNHTYNELLIEKNPNFDKNFKKLVEIDLYSFGFLRKVLCRSLFFFIFAADFH